MHMYLQKIRTYSFFCVILNQGGWYYLGELIWMASQRFLGEQTWLHISLMYIHLGPFSD